MNLEQVVRCSNCEGGECVTNLENVEILDQIKVILFSPHGAVMCKTCSALWNRDENSSRNIYKISYNAINEKERPSYLSRSKNCESVVSGTTSVCRLQCNSSG